jgi:hypothetical protein
MHHFRDGMRTFGDELTALFAVSGRMQCSYVIS